jgi:hypothetical protein
MYQPALPDAHIMMESTCPGSTFLAPHPDSLALWYSSQESLTPGLNTTVYVHPPSVSRRSYGGGWLTVVRVPVSQVNDLLSTQYQLY